MNRKMHFFRAITAVALVVTLTFGSATDLGMSLLQTRELATVYATDIFASEDDYENEPPLSGGEYVGDNGNNFDPDADEIYDNGTDVSDDNLNNLPEDEIFEDEEELEDDFFNSLALHIIYGYGTSDSPFLSQILMTLYM